MRDAAETVRPGPSSDSRATSRTVLTATLSHTLSVLPIFLLGGLAVFMRADLGFAEAELGAAVSLFFALSAVGAVTGGRLAERFGAERSMRVAALATGVGLLGVALFTSDYWTLVGWLSLTALASALAIPATGLALARGVPARRLGLAFGVKQTAIPIGSLVAGLAVPVVGLTVGWPWAFVIGALGTVLLAVALRSRSVVSVRRRAVGAIDSPLAALVTLGAAHAFAAASGISMNAFYVESAVSGGVDPGLAGLWFALGGLFCVISRLVGGWRADHVRRSMLPMIAMLMVAGGVGFFVLAEGRSVGARLLGTMLAFAAGQGWSGLFDFEVVRRNPRAPAAATGITYAGASLGGVAGPLLFGMVVEEAGYTVAWTAGGGALVVAGLLVVVSRRLLGERSLASQ